MTHVTTEPGVEDALKELREMFPNTWIYVESHLSATRGPRGGVCIGGIPRVQVSLLQRARSVEAQVLVDETRCHV